MANKVDTIKRKMVAALTECKGIVSDACEKSGISRTTHYKYLKQDPQYKIDCNEATESAIDYVESALYKLIKEGNPAAIIFYMKTKARDRGYGEHMKIDQTVKDERIRVEVLTNERANKVASLN